ncbi:tetratricopeptide repeat protein, partial [Pleomorphomonas sp. NRK KF1]|uniref:tetratricopeptide repeat protein n=1 Tax=Pleomorphomonas sp. NRK KF1 TaxID=2943000 RepID=UPI002043C160
MRTLSILLVSTSLVFAANAFGQESAEPSAKFDVKAAAEVIKTSPDSPDAKAALQQLEQAAEGGDPDALYQLGDLYTRGGAVPVNGQKAIDFLQRAADEGHTWAYIRLGELYRDGTVVPADGTKATELFQKAVEAGNIS